MDRLLKWLDVAVGFLSTVPALAGVVSALAGAAMFFWSFVSGYAGPEMVLFALAASVLVYIFCRYVLSSARLRILSATYGAGQTQEDVTAIVRGRMRDGRLTIEASNRELGGDPCKHASKRLTIRYSFGGIQHQVTLPEGATLELPCLPREAVS